MKNLFKLRIYSQPMFVALLLCLSQNIKAQCSANFNFTVGANGNALFASTSSGTSTNTTYTWTIGGAQYSNWSSTLNHIFLENQVASVTLKIADLSTSPTCSSNITKTLSVISAPCYSTVSIYAFLGANGLVTIGAQPLGSGNGTYIYNWSFGDGGTSTTPYPTHTYTAGGVYTITLSASGYSSICNYTASNTISVTIAPCNIAAAYTYTIGTNGSVLFKGTSTGTVPGTTYNWNFDDGSPSITGYLSDTISHTFPSNIPYSVSHSAIILSPFLCADSLVQMIPITNATACSAYSNFQMVKDTTQNFTWFVLASYPSNVSNVSWDWGDNSTSSGLYPSHTYSASGVYFIQAIVTVSCGNTYTYNTGGYFYKSNSPTQAESMVTINVKNPSLVTVGIKSTKAVSFKAEFWPNPNNGNFELKLEGIEINTLYKLKISNLLGQSVFLETFKFENTSTIRQINLEDLPAGTYFLNLNSENNSFTSKIIVTK